ELARERTAPAVVHDVRPLRRVRRRAVEPGGREEELEALHVGGGPTVAGVHVAAADPLGGGCDADLVQAGADTGARVVADRRPGGVGAVTVVVARNYEVEPARVGNRRGRRGASVRAG